MQLSRRSIITTGVGNVALSALSSVHLAELANAALVLADEFFDLFAQSSAPEVSVAAKKPKKSNQTRGPKTTVAGGPDGPRR